MDENISFNGVSKLVIAILSTIMDEFVFKGNSEIQKITRNKVYMRTVLTNKKATPLLSVKLVDSFVENIDRVKRTAKRAEYPYLMVLAENE